MVLDAVLLSIISYGSRVKWSHPENGVAPSLTSQCFWLSPTKRERRKKGSKEHVILDIIINVTVTVHKYLP